MFPGRLSVQGRSFPRTGEVVSPYWGERTLVLGGESAPWVSKIRSVGLKNPLHGSQNSAPWVSKIPLLGLKIPLHGSQKSPASGKPRAVYGSSFLLDVFTLSFIGFLLCLSSIFVPMNLCAAYYSIFCGFRVTSEGLRHKLFFRCGGFRGGFFDIIHYILRGVDRGAGS